MKGKIVFLVFELFNNASFATVDFHLSQVKPPHQSRIFQL